MVHQNNRQITSLCCSLCVCLHVCVWFICRNTSQDDCWHKCLSYNGASPLSVDNASRPKQRLKHLLPPETSLYNYLPCLANDMRDVLLLFGSCIQLCSYNIYTDAAVWLPWNISMTQELYRWSCLQQCDYLVLYGNCKLDWSKKMIINNYQNAC